MSYLAVQLGKVKAGSEKVVISVLLKRAGRNEKLLV